MSSKHTSESETKQSGKPCELLTEGFDEMKIYQDSERRIFQSAGLVVYLKTRAKTWELIGFLSSFLLSGLTIRSPSSMGSRIR